MELQVILQHTESVEGMGGHQRRQEGGKSEAVIEQYH